MMMPIGQDVLLSLGLDRRRLVVHLIWALGRARTPRVPRVDERILHKLLFFRRGHRRHRVQHVHDPEGELPTLGRCGAPVHLACEWLKAAARSPKGVHVSEREIGEGGLGLASQELAVCQHAVCTAKGVSLASFQGGQIADDGYGVRQRCHVRSEG